MSQLKIETVVDRFEKIVEKYPDNIALHTRDGMLTYEELNNQANIIANMILSIQGLGNDRVMLFYRHGGRAMIEAILGVLKAGKAVCSVNVERQTKDWGQRGFLEHGWMDATYVKDLIFMLGAELILTDHNYWRTVTEIAGKIRVVNTELQLQGSKENPAIEIGDDDLCSILHTTGTTGEPKAIKRPHSMELYNMEIANIPTLTPEDRVTLMRTANTASMADMLLALLNGARLCVFDVSSGDLTDWVVNQKITYFRGLGTTFRMLDFNRGKGFPHVCMVNIGGEPISHEDYKISHFHNLKSFIDRYSTSETGHVAHNGYALGDRKLAIADADREGIGEIVVWDKPGRIFQGYLNNPELTKRKLVNGGFFTGDRGKIEEGRLIHLGRIGQPGQIRDKTVFNGVQLVGSPQPWTK